MSSAGDATHFDLHVLFLNKSVGGHLARVHKKISS